MLLTLESLEGQVHALSNLMRALIDSEASYETARVLLVSHRHCTYGEATHILEVARRFSGLTLEDQPELSDADLEALEGSK